jgi:F-type H+-transporting ATPase subunit c
MEMEVIKYAAAGLGAGLSVIGAGIGIGKIGAAALEATGRQPEAGKMAQLTMIIGAAFIEGVAFFSLVICFMML